MNVSADDSVEISVEYGVNGKIQMGKGFPMSISLTNQGEKLSGDLVIYSSPNYQSIGNIVIPVELPKGETKVYRLSIPGYDERLNYQQQQNKLEFVRLYKGDWEDGKKITLEGNKNLRPSYFPDNRIVLGVLSDSPDTLNFLKLTRFNGEPIEFLTLKDKDISDDSKGLEMFDVIVVNDYNVAGLSNVKQQALKDWVRAGGHLMIGSNPNITQQLGEVADLSLMTVKGQSTFADLNFLPKSKNEPTPSFNKVEIMTGDLKDNTKVYYADHSLPMVMNKSYGLGEVSQFAFNIGSQSLSKWEPYTAWWDDVLRKTIVKDIHGQKYNVENLFTQFGNIVDAFPSSFISFKLLIIFFAAYLIFLVPVLYLVLKKLDKRENSWWIIPAVAVISSIAIFIVGAKDRIAGSQLNDISVLSIDDTGNANGYGAVSILTNSGGDYTLTVKPGEFNPIPRSRRYTDSADYLLNYAMVENGVDQTKITFNDVEYWSIRSAVGEIKPKELGKLTPNLKMENGKIVGTIESSLTFDLDEAYLLTGVNGYPLGTIKAGSTSNISVKLTKNNIENIVSAPHSSVASAIFPGFYNNQYGGPTGGPIDKENLNKWKKYELLNTVLNQKIYQSDLNQPLIVGYSSDSLLNVEINHKQAKASSLTLVTQGAKVIPAFDGAFTLSEKSLQPQLSIFEGSGGEIYHNGLLTGENFVAVEPGKYLLTYHLPDQIMVDQVFLNKLKLTLSRSDGSLYHIYNAKTSEFDLLDEKKTTIAFEKNVKDYLTKDGSIVLMFEKNNRNNPDTKVPTVYLEGEYKK